jgi:hypothetical protein
LTFGCGWRHPEWFTRLVYEGVFTRKSMSNSGTFRCLDLGVLSEKPRVLAGLAYEYVYTSELMVRRFRKILWS